MITTLNAIKNVEKPNQPYIAGESVKWYNHSGKHFASSEKAKYLITKNPAIVVLSIYPEEWKFMFTQKSVYKYL